MRTILSTILAAGILAAGISSAQSAPDLRDGTVLVFGDSITQQYTDDPGDPQQGWWSKLAEERNLFPVTSAQGGGGLIKKGFGCSGTSVRERSGSVIPRVMPDEVWVAVGKNDIKVCVDGRSQNMSETFRVKAANEYFVKLAGQLTAAGVDLRNVYVTTPWGTTDIAERHDIVVAFANGARAAGLKFINIPRLADDKTRDGTHPNAKGNDYIAQVLSAGMAQHYGKEPTTEPEVTQVQ